MVDGSLHELFGEIEVTVPEYIADGNRVLSRWTGQGRHKESGREVTWRGGWKFVVAEHITRAPIGPSR